MGLDTLVPPMCWGGDESIRALAGDDTRPRAGRRKSRTRHRRREAEMYQNTGENAAGLSVWTEEQSLESGCKEREWGIPSLWEELKSSPKTLPSSPNL